MEEKITKLRSEIETSFNQEIKEQLCLYNTTLVRTIDRRFSAYQTVMLQIVKDLVQSLVISTNQNNTTQPSPNTPFTHDQSNSNPTHNQPSNIFHHLYFNHNINYSITRPFSTRTSSINHQP